jgi:hypothetical protein
VRGFDGFADRYPIGNLRYTIEYTDVFERLALRSAAFTFHIGEKTITIDTVPFASIRAKQLDYLLNAARVSIQKN